MTSLYSRYPDAVTVNGKSYPVWTDFRKWIRFADVLRDKDMQDSAKTPDLLAMFTEEIPDDLQAGLEALVSFYVIEEQDEEKEEEEQEPKRAPVFSFSHDADYFVAAFRECYGISLMEIPYLHWYEFIALFRGLSTECALKQRMRIRGIDTGKIKDRKERARIRKLQREIALPRSDMSDEEIGDAFAGFFR